MAELILSLKNRELSRHALGPSMRIGRDPASEIMIDNMGVSRHHATLFQDRGHYVIKDEESQNGVFVNGKRVTLQPLRDGDVVQLGKFSLRLNMVGTGSGSPVPVSRGPRDPIKTVALAPSEVQKLVATQQAMLAKRQPEQTDASVRVLLIGLSIIAVVATAAWFILIR